MVAVVSPTADLEHGRNGSSSRRQLKVPLRVQGTGGRGWVKVSARVERLMREQVADWVQQRMQRVSCLLSQRFFVPPC